MKRIMAVTSILCTVLLVASSCTKKESALTKSQLKAPSIKPTELDTYIDNTFIKPYNIGVSYKFNENEIDLGRVLYPPSLDKVKPALEVVRRLWLEPYNALNKDLIKNISPRLFVLVGGYNHNTNGTITLGVAEGGIKISFFNVNQLDLSNRAWLIRFIQTIQHEYVHILNQTKPFLATYKQITPSGYTAQWYNVKNQEALTKGFISPYASLSELEDFAEMVSGMLTRTKSEYEEWITNGVKTKDPQKPNDPPKPQSPPPNTAAIRQKEAIVVEYYKKEYNIDIYKLQEEINNAVEKLVAENQRASP